MTSDDHLVLILRRLDEIERKLDHMLEELRAPTATGYSARREDRWPALALEREGGAVV